MSWDYFVKAGDNVRDENANEMAILYYKQALGVANDGTPQRMRNSACTWQTSRSVPVAHMGRVRWRRAV